jgi:hypothetical protein
MDRADRACLLPGQTVSLGELRRLIPQNLRRTPPLDPDAEESRGGDNDSGARCI